MMYKLLFLIAFLLFASQAQSQFRFSEAEVLVQSQHVWRGQKMGTTPTIEPSLTFTASRFSFNTWAAFTLNNSYSELDLVPSYHFDPFSVTLFDYYNPVPGEDNSYLNFQKGESRHSLELCMDNYSNEKQKLKWLVGTFLLGDKNEETDKPYFSTYLEIRYPFTALGIETIPLIGLTPFRGYYADGPAVVNLGVTFGKELKLKLPFSIPLILSFITNPYTKQSFVIFGTGLAF